MLLIIQDAIAFEEREAPAYDQAAVKEHLAKTQNQWPVQLKLAPKLDTVDYSDKLAIFSDILLHEFVYSLVQPLNGFQVIFFHRFHDTVVHVVF